MRKANVFMHDIFAGVLEENEEGYQFCYDSEYQKKEGTKAVSLTLPFAGSPHKDKNLFPFFDGLIPEGWLLDIAEENWKLNTRDRMELLLNCCGDCIGAVHIKRIEDEE